MILPLYGQIVWKKPPDKLNNADFENETVLIVSCEDIELFPPKNHGILKLVVWRSIPEPCEKTELNPSCLEGPNDDFEGRNFLPSIIGQMKLYFTDLDFFRNTLDGRNPKQPPGMY